MEEIDSGVAAALIEDLDGVQMDNELTTTSGLYVVDDDLTGVVVVDAFLFITDITLPAIA